MMDEERILDAEAEQGTEASADPDAAFDPANWPDDPDTRIDPTKPLKSLNPASVAVRKPRNDRFVRCHPDPTFNRCFPMYEDAGDKPGGGQSKRGQHYLFTPDAMKLLPEQVSINVSLTRLAVAVFQETGELFLWCVKQNGSSWHDSGDNAIRAAMLDWVKVIADMSAGEYRIIQPVSKLPDPVFPNWPFQTYLARAFGNRLVTAENCLRHSIVKRLAGIGE